MAAGLSGKPAGRQQAIGCNSQHESLGLPNKLTVSAHYSQNMAKLGKNVPLAGSIACAYYAGSNSKLK